MDVEAKIELLLRAVRVLIRRVLLRDDESDGLVTELAAAAAAVKTEPRCVHGSLCGCPDGPSFGGRCQAGSPEVTGYGITPSEPHSWVCTLTPGHPGPHIACGMRGGHHIYSWANPPDTKPDYERMYRETQQALAQVQTVLEQRSQTCAELAAQVAQLAPAARRDGSLCKGHLKIGDPACGDRSGSWVCTRAAGHTGPHIACSSSRHNISSWPAVDYAQRYRDEQQAKDTAQAELQRALSRLQEREQTVQELTDKLAQLEQPQNWCAHGSLCDSHHGPHCGVESAPVPGAIKNGRVAEWVCTRPRGHRGLHVACCSVHEQHNIHCWAQTQAPKVNIEAVARQYAADYAYVSDHRRFYNDRENMFRRLLEAVLPK